MLGGWQDSTGSGLMHEEWIRERALCVSAMAESAQIMTQESARGRRDATKHTDNYT